MGGFFAVAVYVLCALTSLLCAVLLWRSYRRTDVRLLLWSSVCFMCLAANNTMLFVDLVILPDIDLWGIRTATAVFAFVFLLWGLLWEGEGA